MSNYPANQKCVTLQTHRDFRLLFRCFSKQDSRRFLKNSRSETRPWIQHPGGNKHLPMEWLGTEVKYLVKTHRFTAKNPVLNQNHTILLGSDLIDVDQDHQDPPYTQMWIHLPIIFCGVFKPVRFAKRMK